MHSDRLVEDEAQNTLRPRRPTEGAINPESSDECPTEEAINSDRQAGVRRPKSINPNR